MSLIMPTRAQTITLQVERWNTYYPDAMPLWEAHWEEVAIHQERIKLDVDVASYAALDASGKLLIVTVRDHGVLVGYWKGLILGHLHYLSTLHGTMDIVYLAPAYRRGMLAWRLFKRVEQEAKDRGVVRLSQGTKIHNGLDLGRLYERLGYECTEHHFTKLL